MNTLLFLITAYIGGKVGIEWRLPAGALLGSMILVGMVNASGIIEFSNISPLLRIGSQVALGTMIGLLFSKKILELPVNLVIAFTLLGLGSILISLILAVLFNLLDVLPFISGLIAVAPGGVAEMLTLSESVGGQTQAVVIVHLMRFVFIMLILKWFIKRVHTKLERSKK